MKIKIKPIILSGGSGSRLWPLSRIESPKQFLKLRNKQSLLLETIKRIDNKKFDKITIIGNSEHRFRIAQILQSNNIVPGRIILEPEAKNTAPAIAVAALISKPNDYLCIMPSDHYIENKKKFIDTIYKTIEIAQKGYIVTLGIDPKEANSEYGYIITSSKLNKSSFIVKKFVEKPKTDIAKKLISEGAYWNSGIFIAQSKTILASLKKHDNSLFKNVKISLKKSFPDLDFLRLDPKSFSKIKPKSFDKAILEKSKKIAVFPLKSQWSDLGTYLSISKITNKTGDIISSNTKNCFFYTDNKLLAVANIENLAVVSTKDSVLVTNITDSSGIKIIYDKLKKRKRKEILQGAKIKRPWGEFENLEKGKNYKVKKLIINPGQKISLQKHLKRSEHWVVVNGVATITRGTKTFKLYSNQSTYIPKGEVHRIENKTKSVLIIIEVQNGKYLGEDDIVRLNDVYGR